MEHTALKILPTSGPDLTGRVVLLLGYNMQVLMNTAQRGLAQSPACALYTSG